MDLRFLMDDVMRWSRGPWRIWGACILEIMLVIVALGDPLDRERWALECTIYFFRPERMDARWRRSSRQIPRQIYETNIHVRHLSIATRDVSDRHLIYKRDASPGYLGRVLTLRY